MLHTNCGELALLFDTFCRIWRAGGQATLTTSTKDGQVQSNLELQLGLPAAARAGAPSPSQRLSSPSSAPGHPGATRRQPCHRGPAAKAKSRARAALHQAAKVAAASDSEGVSPSSPVRTSPNLPEGASSSHSEGVSPSHPNVASPLPLAEPTPESGGILSLASTDTVEATPPLPAPGKASSHTAMPGDASSPASGGASSPSSKPSPASGGDEPSTSGEKPTPSPGDASKFLTAPFFYQCDALVRGGKPCEKIFSSIADVETHNKSDHGLNGYYYGQTLRIDTDKNLYIL